MFWKPFHREGVADTCSARNVALEASVVIGRRTDVPAFDTVGGEAGALLWRLVDEDASAWWG